MGEKAGQTDDQTQETGTPAAGDWKPTGPWADRIAAAFPDQAHAQAVDAFLRETVQPYVTKIEQDRPPQTAVDLWNDLSSQPDATVYAIIEQLHGDEAAEAFAQQVAALRSGETQETNAETQDELPPEVQELVEERRAAKEQAEYDQWVEGLKTEHADLFDNEKANELFDVFAERAETEEEAIELFREFREQWNPAEGETNEGDPPPVSGEVTEGETDYSNVPTLGTQASGSPPAATEKNYDGDFDAAVDDWFTERRAAGELPPVGQV